jgi:putative redox protein
MVKTTIEYQGDKHCVLTHGPSGSKIETDAPLDNNGRGSRFSPTDLMAAALGSCVLTTMAIVAEREGIAFTTAKCEVEKEMTSAPRKVGKLMTQIWMPQGLNSEQRAKLEAAVRGCPVHRSLHPEIEAPIIFHYPQ